MTSSEKHIAQTIEINEQLSNMGSERQVSPNRINGGATVYNSSIEWESRFKMNSNEGMIRKQVTAETKWNSKTSYLFVSATCPQAAYQINRQSNQIIDTVMKVLESYIGCFTDEEKDQIVQYDLNGCFSKNNSLNFVVDRYKCGLDKKDEQLSAELSAILIEAAANALESLETEVLIKHTGSSNIPVLI
jgi:hypothetical protein